MQKTIEEYIQEMRNFATRSGYSQNKAITTAAASPVPATPATVGELIILVTHSRGTFPVVNADVTIFDRDNNIIKTVTTDVSGRTERIVLPALPKQLSETPNNLGEIAKYYNVQIDAENFVSVLIRNVPIFEGVTSLQGYDMLYRGAANNQELQIIELPITNI